MNESHIIAPFIIKDFDLENISVYRFDEIQIILEQEITRLLNTDFSKLLQIMYRLDINEDKFKKALSSNLPSQSITLLVIQRQIQKAETRKKYSS